MCRSAQRRHHHEPPVLAFRTEDQPFAVRRPVRLPVVRGVPGDLAGIAAADLLDPDIEVVSSTRGVGDELAIGRQRRVGLQARIEGECRQPGHSLDGAARAPLPRNDRQRNDDGDKGSDEPANPGTQRSRRLGRRRNRACCRRACSVRAIASSISARASPISLKRRFGSFSRHRCRR